MREERRKQRGEEEGVGQGRRNGKGRNKENMKEECDIKEKGNPYHWVTEERVLFSVETHRHIYTRVGGVQAEE